MAILKVTDPDEYIGNSSDEWKVGKEGSTCHFVDTGEQLIFHDGSWEPDRRLIYAIQMALSTTP